MHLERVLYSWSDESENMTGFTVGLARAVQILVVCQIVFQTVGIPSRNCETFSFGWEVRIFGPNEK